MNGISQMTKPAATQHWSQRLQEGHTRWMEVVWQRLEREYQQGTVKPKKAVRTFELDTSNNPSVIYFNKRKLSGVIEEYIIDILSAVPGNTGDFNGIVIVHDFFRFKKKKVVWASSPVYCLVQMHALDRLTQRSGATENDYKKGLLLAAITSQVFNSAHCFGFSSQMPLILPFQDGLFLGQSDLIPHLTDTTLWEFGKKGPIESKIPPSPQTSVLLGTPPRGMRIRTFIGGEDGLTKTKKQAYTQLNDFFDKYDDLLRNFGHKLLFNFDLGDLAHAVSVGAQKLFQDILNEMPGNIETDIPLSADSIKCAFKNEDEEIQFRKMLDEYQLLLETPALKKVLDSLSNHVR